jgi:hypothetical protein
MNMWQRAVQPLHRPEQLCWNLLKIIGRALFLVRWEGPFGLLVCKVRLA